MSRFTDAFQDFCAGLAELPGPSFGERVNSLMQTLQKVTPEEANWAAAPLIAEVGRSPQPRVSVLGVLGELLCRGPSFFGYLPNYLGAIQRNLAIASQVEKQIIAKLPAGKAFAELPRAEQEKIAESIGENFPAWAMLEFYLAPAMPLFEQVTEARQIARAIGLPIEWLKTSRLSLAWLPRLEAAFAIDDGPLSDSFGQLDDVLAELKTQSVRPPKKHEAMQAALEPVFETTTFGHPDLFGRAAAELAGIAAASEFDWAGEIAGVCGGFVERGADPEPGVDALIDGLNTLVDPSVAFVEACQAMPVKEGESAVEKHAGKVAKKMPHERRAINAISGYCLGTIAHLARSSAARQRHGRRRDLIEKLDKVRWETANTGFLWKMLQVLDEEILVIAPAEKLGWRVHIDGVADNFQLHALIGGFLVGPLKDGKYPGTVGTHDHDKYPPATPIGSRALATQLNAPCTGEEPGFHSNLQLWNWTGLKRDGSLPDDAVAASDHWVWNEGIPADITPFDGTRIVLINKSTIERNWNGGRIFPFMPATFKVVKTMNAEEVEGWIEKLSARTGRRKR